MDAISVLDRPGLVDQAQPLAELERDLLVWAGRVAAGEAELLRLIGEFDARDGWAETGVLSCAHWLSWKLGLTVATARERVRVARALRELPLTAAAFGGGRLSYAQVRALTRVASGEDEQTWLELARHCTASQLEKAVRGVRRCRKPQEDAADPEAAAWRDRPRVQWDDDGTLVLTFRINPVHAPAVMASLEQALAVEQAERDSRLAQVAADMAAEIIDPAGPAGPVGHPGASAETFYPDASAETSTTSTTSTAGASAETSTAPTTRASAETPVPYVYVEPPYPNFPQVVNPFTEPNPARNAAVQAFWEEVTRRRALAAAWTAHQELVAAEAARRGEVHGKATLTDALIRALTRPGEANAVKVVLQVDPMSGWARTAKDEMLPPSTMTALLRTLPGRQQLPRVRPLTAGDLTRHDQGRSSRLVTPAQRSLLSVLDGECCRFPGCTRSTNLHAHHVVFWRDGGATDLSNLVLVCARHHTLIHELGYQLVLRPNRTLIVRTAEGYRLLHHPALPWEPKEDLDPDRHITAATLTTHWNGDRMDLDHVVWVLAQHAA